MAFKDKCKICKKVIEGLSLSQVEYNLMIHKLTHKKVNSHNLHKKILKQRKKP